MRVRIRLDVEVEAESIIKAVEIAETPVLVEIRKQPSKLAGIVSLESSEAVKVKA